MNELLKGNDNLVKAAMVKLVNPHGGHKLLRRSTKHLYPIEVSHDQVSKLPKQDDSPSNSSPEGQDGPVEALNVSPPEQSDGQTIAPTGRPRHQTAIVGEQIRRNYYYK